MGKTIMTIGVVFVYFLIAQKADAQVSPSPTLTVSPTASPSPTLAPNPTITPAIPPTPSHRSWRGYNNQIYHTMPPFWERKSHRGKDNESTKQFFGNLWKNISHFNF